MLIKLVNIQSIKEATYEFRDTGVAVIQGDNSNGKSILFRAIGAIVCLRITDNDSRNALINDNSDVGIIAISYLGKRLICKLHRERSECVFKFVRENGEQVIRTFREGGLKEIIEEFGFACYAKNSICLQLFETFGPMPFVNIPSTTNGEIVESVVEDNIARQFLTNYKDVTYKQAASRIREIDAKIGSLNRVKDSIVVYDPVTYEAFARRLSEALNEIQHLSLFEFKRIQLIPDIKIINWTETKLPRVILPPNVDFINLSLSKLKRPKFITLFPEFKKLKRLDHELSDYLELVNGRCPMCGKKFLDKEVV